MPICPRGHESQAEDWCDYCGFPMTPPPGLAIPGFPNGPAQPGGHPGAQGQPGGPAAPPPGPPGPPPYTSSGYPPVGPGSTPPSGTPAGGGGGYFEPRRTPTPPAGTPTGPAAGAPGVPGAPGPYGAPPPPPPTTGLVNCPICRSPQTGRYCEECGYDFNLATSARPPGTAPGPLGHQPPPAPPQGQRPPQQGYGFPPPAAAPPAAPPAFDPPAPPPYEQRPPQPQPPYEQQRAPYEQPQQPPAPQSHAPQSPYEQRPGFPAAQAAGAAPAAPFEKPAAPGFPDIDYERTGPVYPEPSAPRPGHQPQQGGDSGTSFRLSPPGQQPGGAPQQRATWYAVVAPDHEYFTDMMTRSGPEAAGLYFPQYTSERRVPLTGRGQLRIGRRSQQRGTVPEIDLSVSPEDPGASHQHALLAEQPDGSWVVVDQDSTNGTTMNGSPETLPPHTAIPLNDGDRIHVGAWTTITVHLA